MSFSVDDVKGTVDELVRKGPAYIVGLYVYFYSPREYLHKNLVATLEPAYGVSIASEVYSELEESFKGIDMWTKVKIESREMNLEEYLKKYILERHVLKAVLEEVERRLSEIPEEERKVLSVACAIVNVLKNSSYPVLSVSYSLFASDFMSVSSTDEEYFSKVVSSVLGVEVPNVRALFYKYLLGFQADWSSQAHNYYVMKIYPFAASYIESLALKAPNYVKILDRFGIKSKLDELYLRGEFLKLAVIKRSLSIREPSKFLSYFSGKPYEQLCKEAFIEGIISDCFVNPLVQGHVKEALEDLHEKALNELIGLFNSILGKAGYSSSGYGDDRIYTKTSAKIIHILFQPWPEDVLLSSLRSEKADVNAIVIQGVPSQRFLQYIQALGSEEVLWLFIDKERLIVASNTYRSEVHEELLKILGSSLFIEFMSPTPVKAEEVRKTAEIQRAPSFVVQPLALPSVRRFSSRDILEDVVASALEALGFSVRTDLKVTSRSGTEVEIDVLGEKVVGDAKFVVYASCKNWDKPVEVGVVREEFGRVLQMPLIPHVRVLVATAFTESAKREAIANGFVVIETGEKTREENLERIYQRVFEKLNKLFMGVAPKWLQDLAERSRKVAEEIRKIGDELEKATSSFGH
jgi:hypothetical protein